ncbi:unnamed protein product [Trichobilharzia szidati]|nr:unnamed protein product [Trichobilharzia szidati]
MTDGGMNLIDSRLQSNSEVVCNEVNKKSSTNMESGEGLVKLNRYTLLLQNDEKDSFEGGSQECCVCGYHTFYVCLRCNWAAYCSTKCYNMHRPIHQYYCNVKYLHFPRLVGLQIIPISIAAGNTKILKSDTNELDLIGLPFYSRKTEDKSSFGQIKEIDLIQYRSCLIRTNLENNNYRPACAICGDPCTNEKSFVYNNESEISKKENDDISDTDDDSIHENKQVDEEINSVKLNSLSESISINSQYFLGDNNLSTPEYTRKESLVRFGGMLICTTCAKIQAESKILNFR